MYLVKLINEGVETYINTVNTSVEANRITGQMKFGINTIDTFTFDILPNNEGYSKIFPLKTLVEVINTKTNTIDFKGRVLLPKHRMADSGLLTKTVLCESELGYLMDSTQRYGEYHNISVRSFLELIIDNHNKQVSQDKRFVVGVVDVVDNNDSLYRFLGYEKTWTTIQDKLISRLGGEIRIRIVDGIRYIDYLTEIGYVSPTEIRLAKNLKSIEEEQDPSKIITRLVPLGAKIKKIVVDAEGNESEVDTEERLTVKDVNNGIDYIDDTEAMALFGIVEDSITYDDVNVASILKSKGENYLKANNKIKRKYSINALDLSLIGLDLDSINIYNYYKVINPIMAINDNLRVIEKTIDIENPQNSSVNVGDKFDDIKQYQVSIKRTTNVINEVNSKVNNTINKVNGIEGSIVDIGTEVGNINSNLDGTNGNVEGLAYTVNNLAITTSENTNKILTLETNYSTTSTDIATIKNDMAIVRADTTQIKTDIVTINTKLDEILTILNGGA